jgi:hypothetical protein
MLLPNPGSCHVRATSLHYLDIVRRWLVELTREPWRQGEARGDLNERDRLSFCEGLEPIVSAVGPTERCCAGSRVSGRD